MAPSLRQESQAAAVIVPFESVTKTQAFPGEAPSTTTKWEGRIPAAGTVQATVHEPDSDANSDMTTLGIVIFLDRKMLSRLFPADILSLMCVSSMFLTQRGDRIRKPSYSS